MTSPSSRNTLPGSAFSLVRAKLTRVVARPAARVSLISSGVCDLRPTRAALAVVAKVVRPLWAVRQDKPELDALDDAHGDIPYMHPVFLVYIHSGAAK